jgi:RNA polymerase sigma factor (sigma-70 family)
MPARDEDHRLLADFRAAGSQAAFAQLVARHLDLVYSIARRRVGDAHLAEDVTQAVFLTLARKASSIGSDVVISGWLFNTARLVANNAMRLRQRQQKRELSARGFANPTGVSPSPRQSSPDWDAIAPHLESAMDHLGRGERDAVLLRFYQGMSFKEVAGAIGISEDAAAQRVSRGVAKLRAYFAAHGVNTSADALTMGVAAHAVAAAPAALQSTVATSANAGAGAASAGGTTPTATTLSNGAIHAMAIANLKLAVAVVAAIMLTGTVGVVSYNAISRAAPAPAPRAAATPATAPTTAAAAARPNIDPDMAALLARKLPELNFQQIAASDVIDFLRDVTGANIFVNQRSLIALGGDSKKSITQNVRDISLGDALRQIIPQMVDASSREKITFIATERVIIITAADDIPRLRAAQEWHANMPSDAATKAVLDRALPEVNFKAIRISDTIDFLRDVAGANLFVNWRALEAAHVARNRPITVRLRDIPLRTALWLLLESAQAQGDAPLDFAVDQGVISISTPADLAASKRPATR